MFNRMVLRGVFATCLAVAAHCGSARADFATYRFSGTFGEPWGWNFPAHTIPSGTPYSAEVTFDTGVVGTVDPNFSYYTDYVHAAISLTFLVQGQTYSAFDGRVIAGVSPDNGADYFAFQNFTRYVGSLDDVPLFDAYLALRDYSGLANPGGLMTADLSVFLPSLTSATAGLQFTNATTTVQSNGGVNSLSAVPEPTGFLLTGLGGGLAWFVSRPRRNRRSGVRT